ncbi:hypothetical protein CBM2633_B90042 [Cupriavidus taiwanensis]|nr:hypothetical protein CBM2633_B90042 [Cupriavidus taiwanensis]
MPTDGGTAGGKIGSLRRRESEEMPHDRALPGVFPKKYAFSSAPAGQAYGSIGSTYARSIAFANHRL